MKRQFIYGIFITGASVIAHGQPDSTLASVAAEEQGLWQVAAPVFDNVVADQWRLNRGFTEVEFDGQWRSDSKAVNPMAGKSACDYSGRAYTYTKYRNSTLSGEARYSNGKRRRVEWCETAQPELVYPYLLSDSTGGDINAEQYSFSGSYAQQGGRLSWGGSLSYTATLEYRSVDPRPRNVAGCLDITAAIGYRCIKDYTVAADIDFRRYTQSNDIEFKSEMGVDKIFHLTGPLQHYVRFAGSGLSTHYRGYRYGAGLAVYPESGSGGFLRLHVSKFTFDNVLSDLNKLPMASVSHRTLEATAGVLQRQGRVQWGAAAYVYTHRRHGSENIFGDASSGIYPQIATIDMYGDNQSRAALNLSAGIRLHRSEVQLRFTPSYDYRSTVYVTPRYRRQLRSWSPQVALLYNGIFAGRLLVTANAAWQMKKPFDCRYLPSGFDDELGQLAGIDRHNYNIASHSSQHFEFKASVTAMISQRIGLRFSARYIRSNYFGDIHSDDCRVSAGVVF